MNETIEQFSRTLSQTLKWWRDGDQLALAQSPLATSTLVDAALLTDEPPSLTNKIRALQATLSWSIAHIRPRGEQDWLANNWRHYNLLYHYYALGWLAADVAEQFAIAEQTFYDWRTQAVTLLSHILQEEMRQPSFVAQRRRYAVRLRYDALNPYAQRLLRLLVVHDAVPTRWLHALLPDNDTQQAIQAAAASGMLQQTAQTFSCHPDARAAIRAQLTTEERVGWLIQLARLYRNEQQYSAAARCYLDGGEAEQAAQLVIAHWEQLTDGLPVLQPLLKRLIDDGQLSALSRGELRLIFGRLAEHHDDLPTALRVYGQVLGNSDLLLKARAYYYRAKAYQRVDLDQCLGHYDVCIGLLLRQATLTAEQQWQLAQIYIDRAWIFIQERPDLGQASADLQQAETLLTPTDSVSWTNLYNAQAGLAIRQQQPERVLQMRLRAWVSAQESQRSDLKMKTSYNLGDDYCWDGQYEKGWQYLSDCLAMAQSEQNLYYQALSLKGLGVCLALQSAYANAIPFYQQAQALFVEMHDDNWLVSSSYDLCEAYAEVGEWEAARRQFEQGKGIAQKLGHTHYLAQFGRLPTTYPPLIAAVNDRQQQAIDYLNTHDAISRSEYVKLTDVSKSQAHRDLEEMIEQGIIERVGKGRATRYVLVRE